MSPYLQSPLALGADIVLHSVTKYIGGHSDVVGGVAVVGTPELNDRLRFLQNGMGAVPSPFDCYLALRGLKTLHVRMDRHCANAAAVAAMLEGHPAVERVVYPGLASHPQHALAAAQTRGHGGMITFFVRGGLPSAKAFLESVKVRRRGTAGYGVGGGGLRQRESGRLTRSQTRDRLRRAPLSLVCPSPSCRQHRLPSPSSSPTPHSSFCVRKASAPSSRSPSRPRS